MGNLAKQEFRSQVEEVFTRPRNMIFDRHVFLLTKRLKGKTADQSFGKLRELAKNCDLENNEQERFGDLFITNLFDSRVQKELPKKLQNNAKPSNWLLIWSSECEISI